MKKILLIAQREFMATVANKGFMIGLLIMPALIGLAVLLWSAACSAPRGRRRSSGSVAVIDPTARVRPCLRSTPRIRRRSRRGAGRTPADAAEVARRRRSVGRGDSDERSASSRPDARRASGRRRPRSARRRRCSSADPAARVLALVVDPPRRRRSRRRRGRVRHL